MYFILAFLLLPISVLHLLNNFFFKRNSIFIYYKYFISFTIFYGLIGWLYFFVTYFGWVNHLLTNFLLATLLIISLIIFFKFNYFNYLIFKINKVHFNLKFCLLFSLCFLVLFGDFLESISPLSNYDTLSYHLPIPLNIIEQNFLIVPERALTGYLPLLAHMNFIPLLIVGEEKLLRYFFFTCEILVFVLAFQLFKKKFNINLSMLLSLIVITLPVFIYSAGNGNIEIINILYLLSLYVYFELKKNREIKDFNHVMPAILIGFYAASKLFGILFFLAYLIFLLLNKYNFKQILSFVIFFSIISFQWYLFMFLKTGTPIFPVFYDLIGFDNLSFWNIEQNNFFKDQIRNAGGNFYFKLKNFLIYPFNIFIFPLDKYGGVQLSYGFLFIFSFPILAHYLYDLKFINIKNFLKKNNYLQIFFIFYLLWYFLGSTLYFRYLLPTLLPLIILHIAWYVKTLIYKKYYLLLNLSLFLILFFQITISFIHNFNYANYIFKNETKKKFYSRNIPYFGAIDWVNNNISTNDMVLTDIRAFRYLSKNNILAVQPLLQNSINISTNNSDNRLFFEQIKNHNIAYIIKKGEDLFISKKSSSKYDYHVSVLFEKNCLIKIKELLVDDFGSRTINTFFQKKNNTLMQIYEVDYLKCSYIN